MIHISRVHLHGNFSESSEFLLRQMNFLHRQSVHLTRIERDMKTHSTSLTLSESAVNRLIKLNRNAVVRLVSSTETHRHRQDASDIFSCLNFINSVYIYIFLFSSDLTAMPEILQLRNSSGIQPSV